MRGIEGKVDATVDAEAVVVVAEHERRMRVVRTFVDGTKLFIVIDWI